MEIQYSIIELRFLQSLQFNNKHEYHLEFFIVFSNFDG